MAPEPSSIKVIPNNRLYVSEPDPSLFGNGHNPGYDPAWTNDNWLKSRFHFSFAEYHNPSNSNYGVLRVMNDDLVQPHRGFGTHPHRDMEIITYIVHGQLTHEDSMGTKESLGRGSIQFMTAGTGILHSEYNAGDTPLRFIQTWIVPSQRGLTPRYGSSLALSSSDDKDNPQKSKKKKINQLQHLVSPLGDESDQQTPVQLQQDVHAFAAELELNRSVEVPLRKGRQAYLLCIEGRLQVNAGDDNNNSDSAVLHKYDACEISGSTAGGPVVQATSTEVTENGELAHFLVFTMDHVPGSGRKDF